MQNEGNFRYAKIFYQNKSSGKVFVHLFQKVAELETASRFNARASALASALQKDEASLRLFGQSRSFPNVGKDRALSPRAENISFPCV